MRRSFLLLPVAGVAAGLIRREDKEECGSTYKHVAVISADGLHASDIDKYVALGPSNFSILLSHGTQFTNAWTSAPSDSFPGTLAQFTGASPRTHGVWYDDTYDRTYYAPGSNCSGPAGAEVVYDESIDYNDTLLFSGGINPENLPRAIVGGKCTPIYPHKRVRVNTVFEVAVAAGLRTAYTDKHPAYDIVRGPSGTGLTTGYFPEINWAGNPTDNVTACMKYDQLHVNAWLGWLDGKNQPNAEGDIGGQIPALFGGNFQTVSVGQKTKGYVAGSLAFSSDLKKAIDFVDASIGLLINKLKAKGIFDDTLIIVASKHGQAPIDPTQLKKIDPKNLTSLIGVKTDHITTDDVALVFLSSASDLNTAVKNLNANKAALAIDDIIYGQRLIDLGFGDPSKDPAVPDIIIKPVLGVIYTTSATKIAEHGGLSQDDRHVACIVSNPKLAKKQVNTYVETKQIGPTILKALGLDPSKLTGAVLEKTKPLDGF
ncbi:uncharacterized protein PV09_06730 [Verruconis gallopava]|uniref:Type I phosphodiesterase/nucleotide pyrophosphatase n=1 Tax=Verruconis gallopava TaxID=253628 RepID=A0A0D2A546_9PEZI|nr:uncharacterized protein PV09_06730 [Verruconis gallopava]KIW01883.1 hypothetical protein PV09_06730 [Verruconis gallopava]